MHDMKNKVLGLLKDYTCKSQVHIVDRGNTAILAGFMVAKALNNKRYVLIQDQGGWLWYEKLAKKAGLEVKRLKTVDGVIKDLTELDDDVCCVIYAQPSGYCLKQDSGYIFRAAKKKGVIVIMDCSGSVGNKLCNGRAADFIVGSFSKWKPVDMGRGGFIAYDALDSAEARLVMKKIIQSVEWGEGYYAELLRKLQNISSRYQAFNKTCQKITADLSGFEVLYDEGIVVIVKYKNDEEKNKIIKYCELNAYEYTECPREIRVNSKAISIEVKRGAGKKW